MSRNLCQTHCHWCSVDAVVKTGPDRPVVKSDCGRYFDEFQGMIVADGECRVCHAKYLCWVDERARKPINGHYFKNGPDGYSPPEKQFFDLSYRSSFNDEPGDKDCGNPKLRNGNDIAAALDYKDALLRECLPAVRNCFNDPKAFPEEEACWGALVPKIKAELGIKQPEFPGGP